MGIQLSEEFVKKFGKKYPPEVFLAREGESGKTMFLIYSGKVAIIKKTPAGEKVLATLTQGDFFGEMAIVGHNDTRGASAKTVAETMVLELDRVAFEAIIRRSPEIAMSVITTLADRVRDTNGKAVALIHKDDNIRISAYIHHLCGDKGLKPKGDHPGVVLTLNPGTVATMMGVGRDVVDRYISLARKARILGQNGDWIWVPYPSYLLPFAELLKASVK